MVTQKHTQYDPRDHIQQVDMPPRSDEVLEQREITIQSYQVDLAFDYQNIDAGLQSAWLSPALRFGVFSRSPTNKSKTECSVVLGLQDKQTVRAYDYDARRPIWYNWMNAIVDTVNVNYFKDDNGLLRFTTTGAGRRINEETLEAFNNHFLCIPAGAVNKRQFDFSKLRDLCFGSHIDRLYSVRFTGPSGTEYKSIDHGLFQSKKYIDPDTDRLKELERDKKVKIEFFESDVSLRDAELSKEIKVRFGIKGASGSLRLKIPKLTFVYQHTSHDELEAAFYRIVNKAVNAILDDSYYTSTVLLLSDLGKETEMFPELVDLNLFRKVLKTTKNRQEFFDTLDLGRDWNNWLPHLRVIDNFVEVNDTAEEVSELLQKKATRSPLEIARLIGVCRGDAKMRRIGELAVRATAKELYGLPPDVRGTVEGELLTWALKHETEAWRVDPDAGELCVYNLRWAPTDLSLDRLHEALILLVEQLHKRLCSPRANDIGESLLRQLNWCLSTVKVFPANYESLHVAFRLVAENRAPCSVDDGAKLFRETTNDWADVDRLTHEQFGLPLWPCLEATRQGKRISLKNTGLGAALSASAVPAGAEGSEDDMPAIGDLPPGCETTLTVPGKATALEIRYLKFGEERKVTIPIRMDAATGTQTVTAGPDYGWAKQAELVRAYECVVGKDEAFDRSILSKAVKNRYVKSNGQSGHACLVDVGSFKAWIAKDKGLENAEIRQLENAIIGEIRDRKA